LVRREGKDVVLGALNPAWAPVRISARRVKLLCRIVRHLPLVLEG
jgi:SOS-response transcriptional repressor LexA